MVKELDFRCSSCPELATHGAEELMRITARPRVLLMTSVGVLLLLSATIFLLGSKLSRIPSSEGGYLAVLAVMLWLLLDRRKTE